MPLKKLNSKTKNYKANRFINFNIQKNLHMKMKSWAEMLQNDVKSRKLIVCIKTEMLKSKIDQKLKNEYRAQNIPKSRLKCCIKTEN